MVYWTRCWLPLWSTVTLLLLGSPADGRQTQEPAAEATPSAATTPAASPPDGSVAPAAIPVADIPARADEDTANLRRVESLAELVAAVTAIEDALPAQATELIDLREALDAADTIQTSGQRLDDQRIEWEVLQGVLDGWLAVLQARWTALQSERADLLARRELWTLTRTAAVAEAPPPAVIDRIDGVLALLGTTDTLLLTRSDALAVTINQVTDGVAVAVAAQTRLGAAVRAARGRALTRDAEPFWRGLSAGQVGGMLSDVAASRQYWTTTLVDFVEARQGRFYVILLLFAVLLPTAFATRRWSRSWPTDDDRLDGARQVISRPVATALIFTIVAMTFLLPRVVGPVTDVVTVLVLVVVLRLGPGLVRPHVRPVVYGVCILVVLNMLWNLAPDGSALRRLLLLVVNVVALLGLARLIRRWRPRNAMIRGRWTGIGYLGLCLAAGLLALSLGANTLGWFALSQTIVDATVISAYAAIAWIVVFRAAVALLPVVPHSVIGRLVPSISRFEAAFVAQSTTMLAIVATLMWTRTALVQFQQWEGLRDWVIGLFSATLTLGSLALSIGGLLAALVILSLTFPIARLTRFVLIEEILPRFHLPGGMNHTVTTMVNYAVVLFGLLLAGSAAGVTGTQLVVVFGALSVGIGFGLQNVVNNFVSGLILMFERPIKVGDKIETSGRFGTVTQIGLRASTVRTPDGAEVVVPNADLISKEVINWTLSSEDRRLEVLLRAAYGTDVDRVLEALMQVASEHPEVLDEPPPTVHLTAFGESALEFRLLAWVHGDILRISSELHVRVARACETAGIRIPFPQRELHVRSVSPGSAVVVDGIGTPVRDAPAGRDEPARKVEYR